MTEPTSDDTARRAYWTSQMELGYELIQKVLAFPVVECGEAFASIPDAARAAGVEIQFSNSRIAGSMDRVFFMRRSLVEDVVAVGRAMNARGWILKVEDAYRSLEMQRQLLRKPAVFDSIVGKCKWENGGAMPPAELVFRRAAVLIANIPKIGTHMSGSAIDISVFNRADGKEVWRGKPYLEMSERTPMRSPFVDADALNNRLEIMEMVEASHWVHFPYEFWHYNKDDAMGHVLRAKPEPAKYGPVNWNPATNQVKAVTDPMSFLNPMPVIENEIIAAMARAGGMK